eukprot:scaffold2581_cov84-Skeletonema_dohrnii-CCMP3373.AAC.6
MMRVIANVAEKSSHHAAVGKYCALCDCSLHLKRMRTIERVYRQLSLNPPLKMLVGHRIAQLKFPAPWVGHQSKGWICIMGLSMTIHPPPMERGVECQLGSLSLH